jgi:hypothetical protein
MIGVKSLFTLCQLLGSDAGANQEPESVAVGFFVHQLRQRQRRRLPADQNDNRPPKTLPAASPAAGKRHPRTPRSTR